MEIPVKAQAPAIEKNDPAEMNRFDSLRKRNAGRKEFFKSEIVIHHGIGG